MKRKFLLLALVPLFCFSQKVKTNEFDKFIKKQRIELEPVVIHSSDRDKLALSFNSLASTFYLQVSGSGWGASTIDADNELILLFSNDSTVIAKSTSLQPYEPGLTKSTYRHQYYITSDDVEKISRNTIIGIRKYSFKEFNDITISKENSDKIRKLSGLFLDELKKANVLKTLKFINLRDIDKHIGDSVMFCTKVYNTRYFEASDNKPTLLDVQADFSARFVNAVILEEDRKNFSGSPEKIYLNKEVCISGIVELRNGAPYVAIRNRSQVKLLTPISAEETALFVGDSATVNGRIFTGKTFEDSQTLPTLLNMGAAYPDQPFTVVIEKRDRKNFIENPEVYYLNKEVSVTGKIVLYKGKPQMIIRTPDQIKVINETPVLLAKMETAPVTPTTVSLKKQVTVQEAPVTKLINLAAEFPGGMDSLSGFLGRHLQCPDDLKVDDRKTVIVGFVVNKDGSLSNIQIRKSAGKNYDNEVIRVLKAMPNWNPRIVNGYATTETFKLPITFNRIEGDK